MIVQKETELKMQNNPKIYLLPPPELEKVSKKLLAFNAVLCFAILAMSFVIYGEMHKSTLAEQKKEMIEDRSLGDVRIQAKSAYVFDVYNQRSLFEKNKNAQLPLASITKLMTALTALELSPHNPKVAIKKEFLQEEGDSGLLVGETWNLKDLLDFSLVASSNDGVRSIASVIGSLSDNNSDYDIGRANFIKKMNEEAKKIGLNQTYFINESGLDEKNVSGGYSSAEDISKLVEYIMKNKPEILEATRYPKLKINSSAGTHVATNTNIIAKEIPGLIASKTGYTDMAGGNLVIAFDSSIGHPIIIVVLGSTESGRFEDVDKLVKVTLEYLSK